MKSTDSRECCHCYHVAAIDTELHGMTAQTQQRRIGSEGKTCIDRHFGMALEERAGGNEPDNAVATGV
jgi:cytochrome c-type protein NapC